MSPTRSRTIQQQNSNLRNFSAIVWSSDSVAASRGVEFFSKNFNVCSSALREVRDSPRLPSKPGRCAYRFKLNVLPKSEMVPPTRKSSEQMNEFCPCCLYLPRMRNNPPLIPEFLRAIGHTTQPTMLHCRKSTSAEARRSIECRPTCKSSQ